MRDVDSVIRTGVSESGRSGRLDLAGIRSALPARRILHGLYMSMVRTQQ